MHFFEEPAAFRIPRFYATYNGIIASRSAKKEAIYIQPY
jgi:hypothetical protein